MDHFSSSAKTLTLVAIILEGVITAFLVFYLLAAFAFASAIIPPTGTTTVVNPPPIFFSIFFIIGIAFGAVGVLWIFLDYFLIYKKIDSGDILGAKDASLVLGILQLIFGGIITGILLLVAFSQLGNSLAYGKNNQNMQ